jgi:two-component system, OmpR family, phosphate regulon response regulator PhoB
VRAIEAAVATRRSITFAQAIFLPCLPGASPRVRKRLLLVEADAGMAEQLTFRLRREGWDVEQQSDGEDALLSAKSDPPDLVLLNWTTDSISGLEVCRRLRRTPGLAELPIIMISWKDEVADRIAGLRTGADDYLPKPFSHRELVARIAAVLRRVRPELGRELLHFAGLEMDLAAYRVRRDGRDIALGPTEFRLLRHFLENPRHVLTRERLVNSVWGEENGIEARTVDVHVRRLRQALHAPGRPDLIRTVREVGYSLDDEAA